MTREEAIKILKAIRVYECYPKSASEETKEAIDMAIEALSETSGDLISRQDALKPFCISPDGTRIPEVDCDNFPVEFSVEFIKKHLLSLPSADAVHGEWVRKYDDAVNCYWYECNQCGEYRPRNQFGNEYNANYCPMCGARMEGGGE